MTRRDLIKAGLAVGAAAVVRPRVAAAGPRRRSAGPTAAEFQPEFIVVGSGPGGGTVAARLAERGHRVLVLEAGGDPHVVRGGNPSSPGANTLREDYDVPAFHPLATENDGIKWDFWVRHYDSDVRQRLDPKYRETHNGERVDGVWYPRAGTLGGCSAHNAMIFICPHNADWNEIADLTGDDSWKPERMRAYFERLEHCRHRPKGFARIGFNPARHGFDGWLDVEHEAPREALRDRALRKVLLESAREAYRSVGHPIGNIRRLLAEADPNDWRTVEDAAEGLRYMPLTTREGARVGARERLLDVQRAYPDRLKIELHALVTRVLFDGTRAIGVEYRSGERLYRAHARPNGSSGTTTEVRASREVILAGGVFNTPQLLMLSGIGPSAVLADAGIPVRIALNGVGANLQDRYEAAVVNKMNFSEWEFFQGAEFRKGDPQYQHWEQERDGIYASNGSMISVVARSSPGRPSPDLFCYAVPTRFPGYAPGYSRDATERLNYLTWIVLKGHTNNTAGAVTVTSNDPCARPSIRFRYFEEGNDAGGDDLRAVVEGLKLVRRMTQPLKDRGLIVEEELPGKSCVTDDELAAYVRAHAWGHHASCTCPIGAPEHGGVVSSDFRVHGTRGLRIVDASVFPRVPGLFLASAVYMIGEKAADVIAEAAVHASTP
jgi:choline dehydrogenase-like flavoprotein